MEPAVTINEPAWAHNGVLWRIGERFIDAAPDTAADVVAAALDELVLHLDAVWLSVSTVDHRTMRSRQHHRWADGPEFDVGADTPLEIDADFGARFLSGDGTEVAPLEEILGTRLVASRGWLGGSAVVSLIDQTPTSTTGLVVVGFHTGWTDSAIDLMRGFATLVRQFNARIRVEEELSYRLELEDLVTSASVRLTTVGPDDCDDAVLEVLGTVHDALRVESVVLVEVVGEHTIDIRHLVGGRELPSVFRRLDIPDLSRLPDGGAPTLAEYVAHPRVLDIVELVETLAGPELVDALELRDPPRTLALLPASVTTAHRSVIALTRLGADSGWLDEEFDAMTTLASVIAQTRGRVAAESASGFRLEVQRALAQTAADFLTVDEAGSERAVNDALARMGASLDAQGTVVGTVALGPGRIVPGFAWFQDAGTVHSPPSPSSLVPADHDWIERLAAGEVIGGVVDGGGGNLPPGSSYLLAPIRSDADEIGVVGVGWIAEHGRDGDVMGDILSATADLIGQLRNRVRAQADMARRLELDRVLAEIADRFVGAAAVDHDRVIEESLTRICDAIGLAGATVRPLGGDSLADEVLHAPHDGGRLGERSALAATGQLDRLRAGEWIHLTDPPTAWVESVRERWGFVGTLVAGPVQVGAETRAVLSGVRRDLGEWSVIDLDSFRSLGVMLGQLRARVEAERKGERQLAAQRVLGECAVQLAEARADDLRETIHSVLAEVGEFLGLDSLASWQVDGSGRRYLDRVGWPAESVEATDDGDHAWGDCVALDAVRRSGLRVVDEIDPVDPERSVVEVAIPRGDGERVDSILLASGGGSVSRAETVQLLEALSRTIHQVETRVAAERYADAAFAAAPIGVVLRDSELRVVACNQAFAEFIGAETTDELVGTTPEDIHDDSFDDVVLDDLDGTIVGEAPFRRRNGGRVWGQMRATIIEGAQQGESLWLIHIEDVTERRRSEQLLRFQASHDELTGLANRRELLEEVRRIAAGSGSVAILLLDLDRFKLINDSLGHDRGDELLVVVADRLRLAVRPGDLVARLGGDEFAVVLPGPVSVNEAEYVADRLLGLIGDPVTLGRQEVFPTASIGIAVADDGVAVSDLLRRADTAMYRAKAQGRARHEVFDERLRDEVMARMATEAGLRGALRNDEFVVHYQPEIDLVTGEILAAEALVRWNHPDRGLLAAGTFIEIAEETGLVVEIGELVLAEACAEAASWPGGVNAPLLRVNIAAAQIQRDDTIGVVQSALAASGLPAERLCLEITESAVMSDLDRSGETLDRLKELGVLLAVDDFGTGFSSLAYLKLFPVDVLKIDRAFVSGLGVDNEDAAFVRSIVSLAEALDLDVVAEGVETTEQSDALLSLGCVRAQGYLFARPGPAAELRALLGPG